MWASRPHHVVPIVVEVVQVSVGVVVVRSLLLYDVVGTKWGASRRGAIVTAGTCHVQLTPAERFESLMSLIFGTYIL